MTGVFGNVSTEAAEKFFMSMAMFDSSMPHTQQKLSPITFSEFLNRNQILILAPFNEYEEANKIWRKFYSVSSGLFQASHRCHYDLDQAELKHEGWNMMIDYLNRLLEVEKMSASPYYQMHYLAHVVYNFNHDVDLFPEKDKQAAYKTIFNDIINPILYEPLIPVRYAFLPIENYADIRFNADVTAMCAKCRAYISMHSGSNLDYRKFDEHRSAQILQDVKDTITGVYKNKYKDESAYTAPVNLFLGRCSIYKYDIEMCELYDMFRVNGMECVKLIDKVDRFSRKYSKGVYEGDPDEIIDALLDFIPVKKEGASNAKTQSSGTGGNNPKVDSSKNDAHQ